MTVRIALIEDHPIVIEGLKIAFEDLGKIVGITGRSKEIIELVERTKPEILITEARVGGKDALKPLVSIMTPSTPPKVIVFSSFRDSSYIARASALGCYDFIRKTQPSSALVDAVRNAIAGTATTADSLLVKTRSRMTNNTISGDANSIFTKREIQVLRHISMGLSNREVGKSLGITVETVKEHVQHILQKLKVNDRTRAAVWAVKRGLG